MSEYPIRKDVEVKVFDNVPKFEISEGEWVEHYCQVERNWLIYCKTNIPSCKHCGERL